MQRHVLPRHKDMEGQASLRVWSLSCTLRRHGPPRLTGTLSIPRRRHISTVTIRDRVKLQTIRDPLIHGHLLRDAGTALQLLRQLQCRRHPYFRAMSRFVISLTARSAKIPWSMSLVSSSIVVLLFQREALVRLSPITTSSHQTLTRAQTGNVNFASMTLQLNKTLNLPSVSTFSVLAMRCQKLAVAMLYSFAQPKCVPPHATGSILTDWLPRFKSITWTCLRS